MEDTEIVRTKFKCPNPECDHTLQIESGFSILIENEETKIQVEVYCPNCTSFYTVFFIFDSIKPIEENYTTKEEELYFDWREHEENSNEY